MLWAKIHLFHLTSLLEITIQTFGNHYSPFSSPIISSIPPSYMRYPLFVKENLHFTWVTVRSLSWMSKIFKGINRLATKYAQMRADQDALLLTFLTYESHHHGERPWLRRNDPLIFCAKIRAKRLMVRGACVTASGAAKRGLLFPLKAHSICTLTWPLVE